MNKIGIVRNVDQGMATIQITRDSSCGENCAMCGLCFEKNMLITVNTDTTLVNGDLVSLETNTKYVLISAFYVYILPILMLIIGYAVTTLYIGISLMLISFIILYYADKKINKKNLIKVSKMH